MESIAVGAYLFLQGLWIVSVDQSFLYRSDVGTVVVLSIIAVANLGLGVATGWWLSPAFPLLTVALAVPLGFPNGDYHEPLPIWFGVLLIAPVEAVVVALGVTGRRLWDWCHSPRAA